MAAFAKAILSSDSTSSNQVYGSSSVETDAILVCVWVRKDLFGRVPKVVGVLGIVADTKEEENPGNLLIGANEDADRSSKRIDDEGSRRISIIYLPLVIDERFSYLRVMTLTR